MAGISASAVKELRERTGSGLMDCKNALKECDGKMDEAIEYLRKKGIASASKKAGRKASEGLIFSYIHPGNKVGVLLELNCETDFVAKTDDFMGLAKDIAMHIAAMKPQYVSRDDVPEAVLEKEKEIIVAQLEGSNKPQNIIDNIVKGKIEKGFLAQACLLEQTFVKDSSKSVKDLVAEQFAKLRENIQVRRFVCYNLGEGLS